MNKKKCSLCGEIKTKKLFGKTKSVKDGMKSRCNDCLTEYTRAWRRKNNKKYNEYQRKYHEKTKMKNIKSIREKDKIRRSDPKNRLRIRANQLFADAIRNGDIVRATKCVISKKCDNTNIEGHHFDYNRKYEVIWLCSSCHQRYHNGKADEDIELRKKIDSLIIEQIKK